MKKVAKMLRGHCALAMNWFHAKGPISSGVVEDLNAKTKLISKNVFGVRSYDSAEIVFYHAPSALPELD